MGQQWAVGGCWLGDWEQVDNEAANCHCIVCRAAVELHQPLVSVPGNILEMNIDK